jgi:trehalose/maltose hydrolase-like predicted phosphorylase
VNAWHLVYEGWDPEAQPLREALCTLGNGCFATRGAGEEARAGGPHYPGTYLAGGYDRLKSRVKGRVIENEDLVNWPNWLCLTFRRPGGSWFRLEACEILEYLQALDIKRGILHRRVRFRERDGRVSRLLSRRIVHMGRPHIAAIEWTLTPENWSGPVEVRAALDGTVANAGVRRYADLANRHLNYLGGGRLDGETVYLKVETVQSRIVMAQAARTRAFGGGRRLDVPRKTVRRGAFVSEILEAACAKGRPLRVEKVVALYTSRDHAISEPLDAAAKAAARAEDFKTLERAHARAWKRLWHRCDMSLDGNGNAQLALRLNIFHILQTISTNTTDLDAGVPARGLHGEAYRGHIFWDELYIFPFLNLRIPKITRALLMYRNRRLDEARFAARKAGLKGALFPWQSSSDGREESQVLHLNPESGRWIPDNTHFQRHVNAAIAYNVWQYYEATENWEFLSFRGAVMILEIARFWASLSTFDKTRERYVIRGVVGPDEYHTAYPWSKSPGLDNNAYTNVMTVWVLCCALRMLDILPPDRRRELLEDMDLPKEELERWDDVSRRMFVPFHGDGIVSQFEGYEKLEEFDWRTYRKKYGVIQRLDRILEAEGDSTDCYKVGKQADVLMLFYLFSAEELKGLFERMGYAFLPDLIPKNVRYYSERTSHGSTLSRVVHAWVLARSDREDSWRFFKSALTSDLADIQGGTTSEGIHLGAMAGTTDIVQRCYMGIEMRDEVLWLHPCLPREISGIRLRVRYRGHWITLKATRHTLTVSLDKGWHRFARIGVRKRVYVFEQGQSRRFRLD